jgi:hypothetical protein
MGRHQRHSQHSCCQERSLATSHLCRCVVVGIGLVAQFSYDIELLKPSNGISCSQ